MCAVLFEKFGNSLLTLSSLPFPQTHTHPFEYALLSFLSGSHKTHTHTHTPLLLSSLPRVSSPAPQTLGLLCNSRYGQGLQYTGPCRSLSASVNKLALSHRTGQLSWICRVDDIAHVKIYFGEILMCHRAQGFALMLSSHKTFYYENLFPTIVHLLLVYNLY